MAGKAEPWLVQPPTWSTESESALAGMNTSGQGWHMSWLAAPAQQQ